MTDLSSLARTLAERLFDLQEAGRIMHESWTLTKREQGFHHPLECIATDIGWSSNNATINKKLTRHQWFVCSKCHADLIPWEELPQKQKDINLNAFKDVFAVLEPKAEAVIREAIEKALQEVERATAHLSCDYCKAVRQVPAAIRSLKQSNSGMEVRK